MVQGAKHIIRQKNWSTENFSDLPEARSHVGVWIGCCFYWSHAAFPLNLSTWIRLFSTPPPPFLFFSLFLFNMAPSGQCVHTYSKLECNFSHLKSVWACVYKLNREHPITHPTEKCQGHAKSRGAITHNSQRFIFSLRRECMPFSRLHL